MKRFRVYVWESKDAVVQSLECTIMGYSSVFGRSEGYIARKYVIIRARARQYPAVQRRSSQYLVLRVTLSIIDVKQEIA